MQIPKHLRGFPLLTFVVLLGGCEKTEITQYEVEKPRKELEWTVPDGWRSQTATPPALGRFSIGADEGTVAVLGFPRRIVDKDSLIALLADTVNLTRPSADELEEMQEDVKLSGRPITMIEMRNEEAAAPIGIIAAIYELPQGFVLGRMMGSPALLDEEAERFRTFVSSWRMPENPEVMFTLPEQLTGDPAPGPAEPTWEVPESWREGRVNALRKGSYVAGPDGAEAQVSVTTFPGDVGGLLANVNRWRGELELGDATQAEAEADTTAMTIDGQEAQYIKLDGEDRATRVLILMVDGNSWFFKMMGPKATVEAQEETFQEFLRSIEVP